MKKARPYEEAGVFAAIKPHKRLQGVGELLRPRKEAASLLSEALHEGSQDCPPFVPILPPTLGEAPRAPQDPAYRRAAGAGKVRQRRNDVKTSYNVEMASSLTFRHRTAGGVLFALHCSRRGRGSLGYFRRLRSPALRIWLT